MQRFHSEPSNNNNNNNNNNNPTPPRFSYGHRISIQKDEPPTEEEQRRFIMIVIGLILIVCRDRNIKLIRKVVDNNTKNGDLQDVRYWKQPHPVVIPPDFNEFPYAPVQVCRTGMYVDLYLYLYLYLYLIVSLSLYSIKNDIRCWIM